METTSVVSPHLIFHEWFSMLYSFHHHHWRVSKYHQIRLRIARDPTERYHKMVTAIVEFYNSSVGNIVEVDHEGPKPATLNGVTMEADVTVRAGATEYTITLPLDRVKLLPQTSRTEQVILERAQSA